MTPDAQLVDYYAKRANEYERIYRKPERQRDLAALNRLLTEIVSGHQVLEIACGTGYWTQVISRTARSVTATDINEEVLQIARAKNYGCEVRFEKTDIFDLKLSAAQNFTAGLAAFWWSHLRKSEIGNFLHHFRQSLAPGALMVFMDNRFVQDSSTPISRRDQAGNTYQLRKLDDGSEYEVVKNFPDEAGFRMAAGDFASEIRWAELQYFWLAACKLK